MMPGSKSLSVVNPHRMYSKKFYTGFQWRLNNQRLSNLHRTKIFAPIYMPVLHWLDTLLENFDFYSPSNLTSKNLQKLFFTGGRFLRKENPEYLISRTFLQSFQNKRSFFKTIQATLFFQSCRYNSTYVKISFMLEESF